MIWGIKDKERIKAKPDQEAKCDLCEGELTPKCGVVKSWHWAHKSKVDCDNWYEPETEWHVNWKNEFPKEQQEIKMDNHRADVKTKEGLIIEFQNSSISPDDICDREKFYGDNMIWILNGETLGKGLEIRDKISYFTFIWKNPSQSWFYSDKQIYIDIGSFINHLSECEENSWTKIHLLYIELKKLIKTEPNEFDFSKYKYNFKLDDEDDEKIREVYQNWSEESRTVHSLEDQLKSYKGRSILKIRKVYDKIPCTGWGELLYKEDFIVDLLVGGKNDK